MTYIDDAIRAQNDLSMAQSSHSITQFASTGTSNVINGLSAIGLISDAQTKSLRAVSGALMVVNATAMLAMAYNTFLKAYRARQTAVATAETIAHGIAQNWTGIAIATATALSVVTVIMAADALSDPMKRADLMSSLRGIVNG